jgi:hypothetical protein
VKAILQNLEPEHSPIFLVGAPRSGTSLLVRAVGLSPDVAMFEETGIFALVHVRMNPWRVAAVQRRAGAAAPWLPEVLVRFAADVARGKRRFHDLLVRMMEYTKIQAYDLQPSDGLNDTQAIVLTEDDRHLLAQLEAKYRTLMHGDFGRAVGVLLHDFRTLAGGRRIAEKTPSHFRYLPLVRHYFPDAQIIFIERDKQDVLASYVHTFAGRHRGWRRAARHIAADWDDARVVYDACVDDERLHRLQYGDLLGDPAGTLRSLYAFLDVNPPDDLANHTAQIKRTPSNWERLSISQRTYLESLLA